MSIPHWMTVGPTFWDTLYLNNVLVPGLAQVTVSPKRSIQKAKAKDKNGITIADNGYDGAAIAIRLKLWEQEQLDELYERYPEWSADRAGNDPIAIFHPATTIARVQAITLVTWSFPPPTDEFWYPAATGEQWFPEPKATKPTKPAPQGPVPPSAFDVPAPDPVNLGSNFP